MEKRTLKRRHLRRRVRKTLASRIRVWQEQLAIDWCIATNLVGEA